MKKKFDVLIIDDVPAVVDCAQAILGADGYAVDGACDLDAVRLRLQLAEYRLILSDLMLPPCMSGPQSIRALQQLCPGGLIVAMSGYATPEIVVQTLRLGAFNFMPKPFDWAELVGVVSHALKYQEMQVQRASGGGEVQPRRRLLDAVKHYFLGRHFWARLDAQGAAEMGVTEAFAGAIGEIEQLLFPAPAAAISQGGSCLRVLSAGGRMIDVWSPLSGTVLAHNPQLAAAKELGGCGPFQDGWLLRMRPCDSQNELANLNCVV